MSRIPELKFLRKREGKGNTRTGMSSTLRGTYTEYHRRLQIHSQIVRSRSDCLARSSAWVSIQTVQVPQVGTGTVQRYESWPRRLPPSCWHLPSADQTRQSKWSMERSPRKTSTGTYYIHAVLNVPDTQSGVSLGVVMPSSENKGAIIFFPSTHQQRKRVRLVQICFNCDFSGLRM